MKNLSIVLAVTAVGVTGAITVSVHHSHKSATVQLETELPQPVYIGTPQNVRNANFGNSAAGRRPPFLVPEGTTNVALGKPVTASSKPVIGRVEMITDGDKEAPESSCVELDRGLQFITIDLETEHEIFAVLVWHYHRRPRAYFDVIVQTADDPDFTTNARTLFNSDIDNSSGLGAGKDRYYVETPLHRSGSLRQANQVGEPAKHRYCGRTLRSAFFMRSDCSIK